MTTATAARQQGNTMQDNGIQTATQAATQAATKPVQPVQSPVQQGKAKDVSDAAIERLLADLQAGKSDTLKAYLATMARFHSYSWCNQMLIWWQRPNSTRVAGYNRWLDLGRAVKKGEKGIAIFAPILAKVKDEAAKDGAASNGKTASGKTVISTQLKLVGFRTVYVFDVSQTDGKPLPEFQLEQASGDCTTGQLARLRAFAASKGITVGYSAAIRPALGMSMGGAIALLPGMSTAQEFHTLAHELAHELLHDLNKRRELTKAVKETEAEAVAYVVSAAFGIDSPMTADYIQMWDGNKAVLMASLSAVQQTAKVLIDAVVGEQQGQEKGQTLVD